MNASAPFVSTIRLGAATLSQIDDGFGGWHPRLNAPEAEWRAALPQADATGYVENNHYTGLIQIGSYRILVDTGLDDPGPLSPWMPPRFRRTPGVVAGLTTLGVRPEEITHVLFTHFHGDHIAGSIVCASRGRGILSVAPTTRPRWARLPTRSRPALSARSAFRRLIWVDSIGTASWSSWTAIGRSSRGWR